ncbi:MAG TPA: hypothetical protein PKY87_14610 [Terricaulis sp.]|nr:hypothetical protein [Terricaulis sp.]
MDASHVIDPTSFIERAENFAGRANLEMSTLARKLFNDTGAFDRVREGRVTYRVLQKAALELELLEQAAQQRVS